jgi:hypothetical protein
MAVSWPALGGTFPDGRGRPPPRRTGRHPLGDGRGRAWSAWRGLHAILSPASVVSLGFLGTARNYQDLYQEALVGRDYKRTEREMAEAIERARQASEALRSLARDLDAFNLEQYRTLRGHLTCSTYSSTSSGRFCGWMKPSSRAAISCTSRLTGADRCRAIDGPARPSCSRCRCRTTPCSSRR